MTVVSVREDEAYTKLVVEHLDTVKYVALGILRRLPVAVELDDLVQAGTLGLLDACRKYKPERGVAFNAYAKHRIRGAILDNLRELAPTTRSLREKKRKLSEASDQLTASLQREPTEEELSERVGLSVEKCRDTIREIRQASSPAVSMDGCGEDGGRAMQYAGPEESRPDMLAMQGEKAALLGNVLRELPVRHRRVLLLYYREGKLMREIGRVMGVQESRVSQIHSAALAQLRKSLQKAGVRSPREV
ncbi:MAG: FliA/WhiG family RNA polymerase sigma factor [Acidobacteria bacterium]|nr:FliA/WhiG family RNA polymerase sigma factor [Acidobacteriota bacterium]